MPKLWWPRRKQVKSEKEYNGDPSITLFNDHDETSIQITIIPSTGHENIRGFNDLTQLDKRTVKRQLHASALFDTWNPTIQSSFYRFPNMVAIPLTTNRDTVLHVAVKANNATFVEGLVNLMTPKNLEIPNSDGNTAFCAAAIAGNGGFLDIMVKKNQDLPLKTGHKNMLPIQLAALAGHHEIVKKLSFDEKMIEKMDPKDVERLFFMTINSRMYDVAKKLFDKFPDKLAIAKDDRLATAKDDQEHLTALHILARKPSQESYTKKHKKGQEASSESDDKFQLFQKLWNHVRQLEYKTASTLITTPSVLLFDAVKSGNVEVVKLLLCTNRELLVEKDSDERSLLHLATLYRQESILDLVLKVGTSKLLLQDVDKDGNNVLHLAAHEFEEEASSNSKPSYKQMRKELTWFQKVKKRVPPELGTMKNSKGKTPTDTFYANHQRLLKGVKSEAKGIANSGMVVAALIAAVVFAAALTVPGDKSNRWFDVFFLTNAIALLTASASIIYFLAIFTSSWSRDNTFFVSLLPRLNIYYAIVLLCVSIVSMVIAFTAASFLVYDHETKRFAYVVVSFGLIPIGSLLPLLSTLFNGLYMASWSSL